jgi:hypothetical protein
LPALLAAASPLNTSDVQYGTSTRLNAEKWGFCAASPLMIPLGEIVDVQPLDEESAVPRPAQSASELHHDPPSRNRIHVCDPAAPAAG